MKPKYLYSDNRIALVRYHINSIFESCFDIKDAFSELNFSEHISSALFNAIQQDDSIMKAEAAGCLVPHFKFLKEKSPIRNPLSIGCTMEADEARDAAVVVV